jgi:glutathione S-transferase
MHRLYYSPGTISLAPHILLRELGAPFEAIRVAVAENRHRNYKTAEFLEVNPRGLVPALAIGKHVLTESVAIALYLSDLMPAKHWLPPLGTVERGRAYEWLGWLATSVHRAIGGFYRPEHLIDNEQLYAPIQAFAAAQLRVFFQEIEDAIRPGSDYLIGDELGVIDPFLLVYFRWGGEIGLDMRRFPRWSRLTAGMLERPAVVEAMDVEEIEIKGFISHPVR